MGSGADSDVLDPPVSGPGLARLAPGTELLGEYRDSAYQEPKFLIRRSDGQVMQLPRLLYRVAGSLDGRDARQVAADLSAELGQELTAEQVTFLVEDRLRPVGVLAPDPADAEETDPADMPVRSDPLLALRYRAGVVPAEVAWRVAGFFRPLFARPAWVALVVAFLATDVWIVAQGELLGRFVVAVEDVARRPGLILAILGVTLLSAIFHECGHVTACRYGGARPGDLGVGLYIIWPAFYSSVTDSYRLDRVGRLRTDLGGIYFNAVFLLGLGLVYLGTGEPWLLIALFGMHIQTAWQFLPSLRLDGYYILADLVGVPDLFGYVRPVILSLLPWRPTHPLLRQLKPRARRLVLLWVVLVVPTLVIWLVVFLAAVPTVLPAAWRASMEYVQRLDAATRQGDVVTTTLGVFQLLLLALPWIGLALVLWSLIRSLLRLLTRRRLAGRTGRISVARRAAVRRTAGLAALAGLAGLLVARVAHVASSHPATATEIRLVESALAGLHGSAGPSAAPGEWVVRAQLMGYAALTGAFDRHATLVTGGRELAAVACGVLTACLLTLAVTGRVRLLAVALPLLTVLAMGPAVTVLATVGPGIVGAAWAATGVLVLTSARHRAAVVVGLAAVAVGVVTEPLIAVPLAVGLGILLARTERSPGRSARHALGARHALQRLGAEDPRRWLGALLLLPVGGLTLVLTTGGPEVPLDPAERTVLLLLIGVVVGTGLLVRSLRLPAAVAGSALLLTVLPGAGAGSALPVALVAAVLLGTLLIAAVTSAPVAERPHPLLRAALAIPVLVLTVTGALFLPATARTPPHQELAAWIGGPASAGGTVAVPAGLWGDLVRDGVPPDRLRHPDAGSSGPADWTVAVGGEPADAAASFGTVPTTLTVQASPTARAEADAAAQAEQQRLVEEAQDLQEAEARRAFGNLLAESPRLMAPPELVAPLSQGAADVRLLAVLAGLTTDRSAWLEVPDTIDAGASPGHLSAVLVTRVDGQPTSRPEVAANLTEWLHHLPAALVPSEITPEPRGVTVRWSPSEPPPLPGS